jgi:hypothetical protein
MTFLFSDSLSLLGFGRRILLAGRVPGASVVSVAGRLAAGVPGTLGSSLLLRHVDAPGSLTPVTHGPARRMSHPEPTRSVLISMFGYCDGRKESPRVSRSESMWLRNCTEAEDLEDAFATAAEDGILTAREIANLRLGLRRNTSRHDENASVIPLACAYLNGGESARGNYHSQVNKRERVNRSAGYRTLEGGDACKATQTAG